MPTINKKMWDRVKSCNPIIDADSLVWNCGFMRDDSDDDPPLGFYLHAVNNVMSSILDVFPERTYTKVYIGGTDNFRYNVAKQRPYKGQRKQDKPTYYHDIRLHLVSRYGAEVINGEEADDAVGKWQWKHSDKSTCIVGQDKDLKTIPGLHYWWKTKELEYINLTDANNHFLHQMLTGDPSDNIPGVPKVGKTTADRIFQECGFDTAKILLRVEREYQKAYGRGWREVMDEMGTLLHIRREDGKVWQDFIYKGEKHGSASKQVETAPAVEGSGHVPAGTEGRGDQGTGSVEQGAGSEGDGTRSAVGGGDSSSCQGTEEG